MVEEQTANEMSNTFIFLSSAEQIEQEGAVFVGNVVFILENSSTQLWCETEVIISMLVPFVCSNLYQGIN